MDYAYDLLILALQLAVFYIVPTLGDAADIMGIMVLIIASTFILPVILGLISKSTFKYFYPAIVDLLFVPTIVLYYNYTAFIYLTWFAVTGYIGLFTGIIIKKLFTGVFKGITEILSALIISMINMIIVMLMLLDIPIRLTLITNGNFWDKLIVVGVLLLPIITFMYMINIFNQRNNEYKLRKIYLQEIKDKDRLLKDKDLKIEFLENKISELNNKSRKLKLDNQTIQGRINKLCKKDINTIIEEENNKLRQDNLLLMSELDKLRHSISKIEKSQEK